MRATLLALAACLSFGNTAVAQKIKAGDLFQIVRDIESSSRAPDGTSAGNSTDRDTIVERVLTVSPEGLTLEYDLPNGTTADERARQWQFPVRVFRPIHGQLQLLNRAELQGRIIGWLKAANLPETACGHWFFTWSAFQVDCDPRSVIDIVEGFDLGPDNLADGALYRDPKALGAAPVKRTAVSAEGGVFHVTMMVDPDAVRRDLAQGDVVAGEVLRKPVSLKDALLTRSTNKIVGTINITFETDPAGRVRRQEKVTTFENSKGEFNGQPETKTSTETLERRIIPSPAR